MLAIIVGLITLTALFITQRSFGSVSVTDEYSATTTDATWSAVRCHDVIAGSRTLGSVVVTLGSNAPLNIYDATTTGPHSNHATTSLVSFKTTATAGTYTFDVMAKRGVCIVVDTSVGVASTTITWR